MNPTSVVSQEGKSEKNILFIFQWKVYEREGKKRLCHGASSRKTLLMTPAGIKDSVTEVYGRYSYFYKRGAK